MRLKCPKHPDYKAIRRPKTCETCWKIYRRNRRRGNCYVTVEALYHLLGGKRSGWKPMTVRHEGDVHWFLEKEVPDFNGLRSKFIRLDPTAMQFESTPPYESARGRGFLTKEPSRRAREMMQRMLWQPAPKRAKKVKRDYDGEYWEWLQGSSKYPTPRRGLGACGHGPTCTCDL